VESINAVGLKISQLPPVEAGGINLEVENDYWSSCSSRLVMNCSIDRLVTRVPLGPIFIAFILPDLIIL
jgi:hypothetical protein